MGLMLSVLVFCVGVAEALDCWHHFLLHLIQPQYNPIPYHLDSKTDVRSERELGVLSEPRRPSHVDICWPKDISPTDDLHVIKKRTHSEIERHVGDSEGHRAAMRSGSFDSDSSVIASLYKDSLEKCSPQIAIFGPERGDSSDQNSTTVSRDSSPNHLGLSVIVESDSSSEVDEPSQIENLAYRKKKCDTSESRLKQDEEPTDVTEELCKISSLAGNGVSFSEHEGTGCIPRPSCPSSLLMEEMSGSHKYDDQNSNRSFPEDVPPSDLPVFTDNILSQNVKKVSCRYPQTEEKEKEKDNYALDNDHRQSDKYISSSDQLGSSFPREYSNTGSVPFKNKEETNTDKLQSVSSILDEGLEPISEFPEIRLQESSPVPSADNSDSSLNTSDASWIAKSKTSDRPLVIRFSPSRERVAESFMSMGKTNDASHKTNDVDVPEELDAKEVYYDADSHEGYFQETAHSENKVSDASPLQRVPMGKQVGDHGEAQESGVGQSEKCIDNDSKLSSVNNLQLETNSSSSSLCGIPQIPEDAKDNTRHTPLPTDNGFSQEEGDTFSFEKSNNDYSESFPGNSSSISNQIDVSPDEDKRDVIEKDYSGKDDKHEPDNLGTKDSDGSQHNELNVVNKLDNDMPSIKDSSSIPIETDTSNKTSQCNKSKMEEPHTLQDKKFGDSPSHGGAEINEVTNNSFQSLESSASLIKDNTIPKPDTSTTVLICSPEPDSKVTPSVDNVLDNETNKIPSTSSLIPPEDRKPVSKSAKKPKTAKKEKKKPAPKKEDPTVVCQAKESDEEDHVGNRAASVSVRTSPPVGESKESESISSDPRPSTSTGQGGAAPSAPEGNNSENKAFWLIFSGEYTKAMNKDWHSGHFCCWQCDESLTGQRYVLRDEHPYCIKCYESVFSNGCEECNKTIGIDSKDLSYKDKHWHEACFLCNKCRVSLVDKQFGSKLDKIFCGNCYDAQFASRCDGCGQIFKAGTKKMEYKTRQWHEPCFSCCVCKTAIGTKSFIPREQEIYCATCYEEKFATRCVKCNKIITSGGVTYKNEPWHRECFTCTNCNTSLAGQRFTSRDEKPYCADCFGELFAKRCTSCCKPITGIGGTRFISFEDRHWHNDCFICASCKTSLVGRGFITDAEDIICPECAKQKLM